MITPVPKPPVRVKKPRKRLVAKTRLQTKTPIKKQNQTRMKKRRGSYQKYLRSPEWKLRRLTALIAADWTCNRCGVKPPRGSSAKLVDVIASESLTVHHKTYRRLGNELPEDLEVLCESCHNAEHASRAIKPRFMRAG